jgi:hypothetical protein
MIDNTKNFRSLSSTMHVIRKKLYQQLLPVAQEMVLQYGKGKGRFHPITGHEVPDGSTDIALLFLQPRR